MADMADMADPADNTADPAHIMAHTADITADILARYRREAHTADILVRYRREADTSSAEVGRNSPAAHRGHIVTGAAAIGAADLVIRTTGICTPLGAGAFLTRLTTAIILPGIILRIGTIMIAIATPLTATPIDLRLPSCSAGWLERATTTAPLMESWGRKLVVRFAPMNGRTWH